jgi:hypothetical protein
MLAILDESSGLLAAARAGQHPGGSDAETLGRHAAGLRPR